MAEGDTVRVYDPGTGAVTRIPQRELSDGMVRFFVPDEPEAYWIAVADVIAEGKKAAALPLPPPPPLSPEARGAIGRIADAYADVDPRSAAEWERELNDAATGPRELAVHLALAAAFVHLTALRFYGSREKRELRKALLAWSLQGSQVVRKTFNGEDLSRETLDEVLDHLDSLSPWPPPPIGA